MSREQGLCGAGMRPAAIAPGGRDRSFEFAALFTEAVA